MRTLAKDLHSFLGKSVTVAGWVNSRRDHGGLIFIDLRDHTDIIQLVITPDTKAPFALAESVRDEYVLEATGTMRERAPELVNPHILFATLWTIAHQVPLSMRILQARILKWVIMSSFRGSSQPRDQTLVSHIAGRFFTIRATKEAQEYWNG